MGNPNAKVKLVEFGSMTCPHCKRFDEAAEAKIIDYVKTGKVSFEFRNYVRDASDVAASTIARCGGTGKFFPLTRALYKDQEAWQANVEGTPQDQLDKIQDLPPDKEFLEIAKAAGLQKWAAQRGLPVAKSTKCLSDEASIKRLIQITQDTKTQFPDFLGTPSFVINGAMVDLNSVTSEDGVWPALEAKIKDALGAKS
jgi:protein-disulfide isomerase